MTKWEYLLEVVELRDLDESAKNLNEFGKAGWEIISMLPRNPQQTYLLIFFKRPKQSY
jgi:hypothetical protein